jgi:hypothetical protein
MRSRCLDEVSRRFRDSGPAASIIPVAALEALGQPNLDDVSSEVAGARSRPGFKLMQLLVMVESHAGG